LLRNPKKAGQGPIWDVEPYDYDDDDYKKMMKKSWHLARKNEINACKCLVKKLGEVRGILYVGILWWIF
jgi:hypothetical protein